MKVIVQHEMHFRSGDRTYVAVARPGVQSIPDWVLNTPVYEVGLWAGFLRPVESESTSSPIATDTPSPAPSPAVAGRRRR